MTSCKNDFLCTLTSQDLCTYYYLGAWNRLVLLVALGVCFTDTFWLCCTLIPTIIRNIFLLVFYPSPLLPTSLQWPLTPLPQVAVAKSFECKNIFPVYLKWAWINRSIKNKSTTISGHKYLQSLQRTYFSASIACTKGMSSSTTFVLSLYLGLFLRRE